MCVLNKDSLPVYFDSVKNLIFNFFETNTFFAVGQKNDDFSQNDVNSIDNHIIFEKFFINQGDDLTSQTMANLKIPGNVK
jgi:hypothetical protein